MQVNTENLTKLAQLLQLSLDQDLNKRKTAEQQLLAVQSQPGFPILLMNLIREESVDRPIRLSGSVLLKNFVKKEWDDANINDSDRTQMKQVLINLMLATSGSIQKQLSEVVAIMAADFYHKWQNIIDEIVAQLNTQDFGVIRSLLFTAHSIFKKYRDQESTVEIEQELIFVVDKFGQPMFQLFVALFDFIKQSENNPALIRNIFECLNLLLKIFYSLNWVDLPAFFEDRMDKFFTMFHNLVGYKNPHLESDEESLPGLLEKTKSTIFTITNLYLEKYDEEFGRNYVETFTKDCWEVLTRVGPQLKYDTLVAKGITFLTTVSKSGSNQLFAPENVLRDICEKIVIPNMTLRDEDVELFEDEPVEYIRRDLEGLDSDTRRRSAVELVKGLCLYHENMTTNILLQKVTQLLHQSQQHWKNKDLCIYLVIAISVKAKTEKKGATQINEKVDVLQFLQTQILPELQSRELDRNILQADAIKFVAVFRQLLGKDAFNTIMPHLINLLTSQSRVVHSYAAWCIERWLNVKEKHHNNQPRFSKEDLKPYAQNLLTNLFGVLSNSQQRENEYVMKAIMRVTAVLKEEMAPMMAIYLKLLTEVLAQVCKNPSNPSFNHYIFESYATVIKYNPGSISDFENSLFSVFDQIRQDDIQEFTPYVFQILSQLLDLRPPPISSQYLNLFPKLVDPLLWQNDGNIPGLTSLICGFIRKSVDMIIQGKNLENVLGVFHKLLFSKTNDHFGFRILDTITEYIPQQHLAPYLKTIFTLLFQRLQKNRTAKFLRCLVVYFSLVVIKNGGTLLIDTIEGITSGLFNQIVAVFWAQGMHKVVGRIERKTVAVAVVKLLCETPNMLQDSMLPSYSTLLLELVKFFELPEDTSVEENPEDNNAKFLYEHTSAGGYKVTFTKLSFASKAQDDPAKDIPSAKLYFAQALYNLVTTMPQVKPTIWRLLTTNNVQGQVSEYFAQARLNYGVFQ
jgi:exportin-2 (importin alpha re-exporter)